MLQLPQAGLFHKRIKPSQCANLKSDQSIQEPTAHEVRVQEPQRHVEEKFDDAGAAALTMPFLCLITGIALQALHVVVVRPVAVMQHSAAECTDTSRRDLDFRVISIADVHTEIASKETQHAIAPPAAETDSVAHEVVRAANPVTVAIRFTRQHAADFPS